ncbi:MAG: SDR family NAD(P)-dependent oxidoreductase [Cellulomonas sp.]
MPVQRGDAVVVTGASSGIGRASAIAFGESGAKVALLARWETGLAAAAEDVARAGAQPLVVPVDVADADAVAAAAARVEAELGPIDVWVNVAFSSEFARFDDISPEEFRRATEVSYLGYMYATMAGRAAHRPTGAEAGVRGGRWIRSGGAAAHPPGLPRRWCRERELGHSSVSARRAR